MAAPRHLSPLSSEVAPARVEVHEVADFGGLIRARRRELGYTQEYLASMLGWSPRLIGEIEHGRGTVGIERVFVLLAGLGIDVTLTVRGKHEQA